MKHLATLLAFSLSLALPTLAQEAPTGWKTQIKKGGVTTFVPPDLRAGEVYSVTIYDAAPLDGKSAEAFLRAVAGPVGKIGQLEAPLKMAGSHAQAAIGIGAYTRSVGKPVGAMFVGFSFDDASIHVSRTLYSTEAVFARYQKAQKDLMAALIERAKTQSEPDSENVPARDVPAGVPQGMTLGGDLVPGVYVGTQHSAGMFGTRSSLGLRIYLYASGEYRICNDQDEDISDYSTGRIKYNRARGRLDIKDFYALSNDPAHAQEAFCVYGRNAEGKPSIYGRSRVTGTTSNGYTTLVWAGPPTGRPSKSAEDAPAKAAQDKLDRIKTVVAPGKGVSNEQIAAIIHDYNESLATVFLYDGVTTFRTDITDRAYLLLRDGSVFEDLLVAPDQFDIRASRQKEPNKWGLWKSEGGKIQISMGGKAYEPLHGTRAIAGTSATRLSGRYVTASPSRGDITSVWGVSFTSAGRFIKDALAKEEDDSAIFTLTQGTNPNSPDDRKGTYSISGYALTLRYDNGRVARMPFFFIDAAHKKLWFEGNQVVDESKR